VAQSGRRDRSRRGEAEFVRADLESPDEVRTLAERAAEVTSSSTTPASFQSGNPRTFRATFDETFAVNVKAPFLLTAAIAPKMVARGGGTIINVTTMAAEFGMPGLADPKRSPRRSSSSPPAGRAT